MHHLPTPQSGDDRRKPDRDSTHPISRSARSAEIERFVLLADEDEIVNDLVAHRLARLGIASRQTTEGDEVEALMQLPGVMAAVISVSLAGKSGFELIAAARRPSLRAYIPIIAIMWPGNTEQVIRAFDSGADDVVEKPFVPAELIARIKRLVRPRRRQYG